MEMAITINGETEHVDVDLDITKFSMKELVYLEKALGIDSFDGLTGDDPVLADKLSRRPTTLQALLYAKVKALFPTVALDDFDLPAEVLEALMRENQPDPEPVAPIVPLTMTLPDGTEIQAESEGARAVGEA